MFAYDLPRARFRRLVKGYGSVAPRGGNKSGLSVFGGALRPFDHKADAIDQTDAHVRIVLHVDADRLAGNEFRLCGHHRLALRGLRKFVRQHGALIRVLHVRNDELFGEFSDKRGFTRTHGTNHPHIDIATRAPRYILVNLIIEHRKKPPYTLSIQFSI